jgi:hypothetical protein
VSDAISRAVTAADAFVARAGAPLERVWWEVLLRREGARPLLAALAESQAPSGALSPWSDAGTEAPLAATLHALGRLDALGLLDHPVGEGAAGFVLAAQQADGGWDEPGADTERRIALTGEAAGLLAKAPFARASALARAEGFLAAHWSIELVQGPRYAPILAYVHALAHVPSELADEALQWCGRELERGFRTQVFGGLAVARVFLRARARALPGCGVESSEVVATVLGAQAPDGGWPAEPEVSRSGATLDAVEALLRLGPGPA